MFDDLVTLAVLITAIGLLWGLILAFRRSILTGLLTLILGPRTIMYFLLFVKPEGYGKPTALVGIGISLAILSGTFQ